MSIVIALSTAFISWMAKIWSFLRSLLFSQKTLVAKSNNSKQECKENLNSEQLDAASRKEALVWGMKHFKKIAYVNCAKAASSRLAKYRAKA